MIATGESLPPGADPVTGDYEVTGQEPAIEVLSGNRVVPAQTIYARELSFGISFQFTLPQDVYMGIGPQAAAADRASWLQLVAKLDYVQAVWVDQDTNAQGLLRDYAFVTVGTADGLNTAMTRVLLDNLNTPAALQQIEDAWTHLQSTLPAA